LSNQQPEQAKALKWNSPESGTPKKNNRLRNLDRRHRDAGGRRGDGNLLF
jgi:hypothetical protein